MRRCPICNRSQVTNSHRIGFAESFVLPLMARRPFRCGECDCRFYGFSFDTGTRRRMSFVLFTLLVMMSIAWGIWHVIDAVTTRRPPRRVAPGTRR
jgi:hypothetical protein